MFSGLIQAKARILAREDMNRGQRLQFSHAFSDRLVLGESIAINGACLTVTAFDSKSFWVEVSPESLERTNLGEMELGRSVNLERSLAVGDRLGGHFVLGHVDGLAIVQTIDRAGDFHRVTLRLPPGLTRYCVSKGSITFDGISLTINKVFQDDCEVMVIPHTWSETNIGEWTIHQRVNVECDYLAKLVEKLQCEKINSRDTQDPSLGRFV